MKTSYIIGAILLSASITFALRALPFFLFSGKRQMPQRLTKLGKMLPSAIMAVLIVYCLKDAPDDWSTIGIPKLIAAAATAISYKWTHSTLLGILLGTACYMVLLSIQG